MTVKTLDVEDTLSKLGQMDKILLLSGSGEFSASTCLTIGLAGATENVVCPSPDFWHTHPVEKLGIPKLRVSDGRELAFPHLIVWKPGGIVRGKP